MKKPPMTTVATTPAMKLISMRVPHDLVDRVRRHLPPGQNFSAFTRQLLMAWVEEEAQRP